MVWNGTLHLGIIHIANIYPNDKQSMSKKRRRLVPNTSQHHPRGGGGGGGHYIPCLPGRVCVKVMDMGPFWPPSE